MRCPFCGQYNQVFASEIERLEEENASLKYALEDKPPESNADLLASANRYLEWLSQEQAVIISDYRARMMKMVGESSVDKATVREHDLANRLIFVEKDNKALREINKELLERLNIPKAIGHDQRMP